MGAILADIFGRRPGIVHGDKVRRSHAPTAAQQMSPLVILALFFLLLWGSALTGAYLRHKQDLEEAVREDLGVILTGALTLLGLVVGFSFSMAVNRYDGRIKYESEEANAISTAAFRAHLLPEPAATRLHDLLLNYARQRLSFYTARDTHDLEQIDSDTGRLQPDIWSTVQGSARTQPTPITALAVSAVTDVFRAQENAQSALEDRLPTPAWILIGLIAVFSNLLVGYTSRCVEHASFGLLILPVLVSCSLALIAHLDSPYGSVIPVVPRNLVRIVDSM